MHVMSTCTLPCFVCSMTALSSSCREALHSLRMPTMKNEAFRFTDLTPLTKSTIQVNFHR